MKKQLLLFVMMVLPLMTSAHDIEVKNDDGVTIFYNYINNGTELQVTFKGDTYNSFNDEYSGNIVIPSEVIYNNITRKVTSIGNYAFYSCSGLITVTISNSVTSIEDRAFANCIALSSVIIPNSVKSIGSGTFTQCSSLTSITIPNSVTSIEMFTFSYCSRLASFTIPPTVTDIREHAFIGCSSLTSITIPNSLKSIGSSAFTHCNGLKKVIVPDIAAWCDINFSSDGSNPLDYAHHIYSDENTEITDLVIPNSVKFIKEYAFSGCSGLTSVNISNNVTSIGYGAFSGCSGLTTITIPNSVTNIENLAFYSSSSNLSTVISFIENPSTIEGITTSYYSVFCENTFNNATLYVPEGTIVKYKTSTGWKNFVHIIEGDPTGIKNIEKDQQEEVSYFGLDGKRIESPKTGSIVIKKAGQMAMKVVVK